MTNIYRIIFLLLLTVPDCFVVAQRIPITTKSSEARSYYILADSLENLLQTDKSKELFLKAATSDSTFAMAWMRAAMAVDNYSERRQYLIEASKYLALVSEGEKLWIQARNAFYGDGDPKDEFPCIKKLHELYPSDAMSNYLYGYMHRHHGQSDDSLAVVFYRRAIDIDPNLSLAYNELCYAYMGLNAYDQALSAIEEYIKLVPDNPNPYDSYAEILLRMGKHDESITAYKQVLEMDPQFPWAFMGIAANLNYKNEFREARKYLAATDSLSMSDYQYRHSWRGKVVSYLDEGQSDSAIYMLRKQREAALNKTHNREPNFHLYYGYQRSVRLLFEAGQHVEGMAEYEQWVQFCKDSLKSATAERVTSLRSYYEAFSAYNEQDYQNALLLIEKRKDGTTLLTSDALILKIRVLLGLGKFEEALLTFKEIPDMNSYNKYWYAMASLANNQREAAMDLLHEIMHTWEMNNIDLALARFKAKQTLAQLN